ncbi:MAG: site-2 protease family protein [Clostridia bacterium]|nr:site-2 protease family protein [Clostridia bacterium]
MDRLEIKLHPLFLVFGFLLIYFGNALIFFNYFVALIIHEYSHYFVATKLGYSYSHIVFMPYGLMLDGKHQVLSPSDELKVALAGPICNLIIMVLLLALWWCYPVTYNYTFVFAMCNLTIALTNLIPLFPLDGGRALVALMGKKISKYKIIKYMKIFSLVVCGIFIVLFVKSLLIKINFTYFTIAMFLLSGAISNSSEVYLDKVSFKKTNKVVPIKSYVVSYDTNIYQLVKYISVNSYCVFYFTNGNKIVSKLSESQLLDMINRTTR